MNPLLYLESRYVKAQVEAQKPGSRSSTSHQAERTALHVWLWIGLHATALVRFFGIAAHYTAVLLGIAVKPRSAIDIAQQARMDQAMAQEQAKRLSEEIMKDAVSRGNRDTLPAAKGQA
jgi:hypothetical protein